MSRLGIVTRPLVTRQYRLQTSYIVQIALYNNWPRNAYNETVQTNFSIKKTTFYISTLRKI